MNAIETVYKGYRFRSRLEARWAVFFDQIGLRWQYEIEGFRLRDGKMYLPDFYLPDWGLWIEIKGQHPTDDELKTCRSFRDEGKPIALFYGLPGENAGFVYAWDLTDSSGGSCDSDDAEWFQAVGAAQIGDPSIMLWGCGKRDREFYKSDLWSENTLADWLIHPTSDGPYLNWLECDESAYLAARQARFEHGESGGRRSGMAS